MKDDKSLQNNDHKARIPAAIHRSVILNDQDQDAHSQLLAGHVTSPVDKNNNGNPPYYEAL